MLLQSRPSVIAACTLLFSIFGSTIGSLSAHATSNTLPPGLVCSAILTGFQAIFLLKNDLENSTAYTARQLEAFLGYSLRRPNAAPNTKGLNIGGTIEQMSDKELGKIASQIAGIQYALSANTADPNYLKYGLTLNGTDSIERYFAELEGTVQTYTEMSRRPDLKSDNFGPKFFSYASKVALPILIGALIAKGVHPFTLQNIVPRVLTVYMLWSTLGAASVPIRGGTQEMLKFMTDTKAFLENPAAEPRVQYFSHTYKILPKTFQQSTSKGFIDDSQTLIDESLNLHRPRISQPPFIRNITGLMNRILPYSGPVSYVTVDFLIESNGPEARDKVMHVFVRASKTKPKDEQQYPPDNPSNSREKWVPEKGQLVPIPVHANM